MTGRPVPEPVAPGSLAPFDLIAPSRLLIPGPPHHRINFYDRQVTLGDGDGAATLSVTTWDGCRRACPGQGSHDPGRLVRLRVPCDAVPHCRNCECGDSHWLALSPEQAANLKAALP